MCNHFHLPQGYPAYFGPFMHWCSHLYQSQQTRLHISVVLSVQEEFIWRWTSLKLHSVMTIQSALVISHFFFLITGTFKIQRGTMNKHVFVVYSLWISYVTTVQWCLFITEKQMLQFRG